MTPISVKVIKVIKQEDYFTGRLQIQFLKCNGIL